MATESTFTSLLRKSVLEFCKDNYPFNNTVTIQGIICLTPGEDGKNDTTVRFHNRLVKTNEKITSVEAEFNLKKLDGVSNEGEKNVDKDDQNASSNDAGNGQIPLTSIKVEVSEAEEGEIPDDDIHMEVDRDEGAAAVTTTGDDSGNLNDSITADSEHADGAIDNNNADPGSPSKFPPRPRNKLGCSPSLRSKVQHVQNSPNRANSEVDSEISASGSPNTGIKSYEKVYVCDVCEKTFLQKQLLQLHKLGHREAIIDSMIENTRLVKSTSTDGVNEKSAHCTGSCEKTEDLINGVVSSASVPSVADLIENYNRKHGEIKAEANPPQRTLANRGLKGKRRWIRKPLTRSIARKKPKTKSVLKESIDELLAANDTVDNSVDLVEVINPEDDGIREKGLPLGNANSLEEIVDYNEGIINMAPEVLGSLNSTTFVLEQNMDLSDSLLGETGKGILDYTLQEIEMDFTCGVCKSSFMDSIELKAHQTGPCRISQSRLKSYSSKGSLPNREASPKSSQSDIDSSEKELLHIRENFCKNSPENLSQLETDSLRNIPLQKGAESLKKSPRISRRKSMPRKRGRKAKQENAAPTGETPVENANDRFKLKSPKKSPVKLEYDVILRPFSCSNCGQSYKTKAHLQAHELTHSDVKPFTCTTCHKGFYRKDHLQIHTRIHTGEKPFKCQYCQISFSDRSNLKAHIGRHIGHRPFKCDLCTSSFYQRQELIDHSNMHAGNKEYACSSCDKRFTYRSTLNKHKRDKCCLAKSIRKT